MISNEQQLNRSLTTKEKERNRQYKSFFVNEIVSYVHEFQHEVWLSLLLQHPNICEAHELNLDGDDRTTFQEKNKTSLLTEKEQSKNAYYKIEIIFRSSVERF